MTIRVPKTKTDYRKALQRVSELMDAAPGTPECDELEVWVHLVDDYERMNFPIARPDPVAAIRFRMEQQGLTPTDLVPFIGPKSRVSEILNGKRTLTLRMIRNLHCALNIPLEALVYDEEPAFA
ncbi:MAG: helix-turn-helix domain-containing protein [Phycisphaerales bacterium]|nr:helix-turn-helix domain-containing protein [Phycisphaerales bacterium]